MRLEQLPESYTVTREALHQLAFFAVAPARYRATERMGLTATPGGFGTPMFESKVARVEGDSLVFETSEAVASQQITTVRAACDFFGHGYHVDWFTDFRDPLQPVDPDHSLEVDDAAARAIGEWFNFGYEVLDRVRSNGGDGDDVSEVQL
ncbi:MAG: hypothetical protein WAL25_00465, partial [Acidimicrobiia bacterium]